MNYSLLRVINTILKIKFNPVNYQYGQNIKEKSSFLCEKIWEVLNINWRIRKGPFEEMILTLKFKEWVITFLLYYLLILHLLSCLCNINNKWYNFSDSDTIFNDRIWNYTSWAQSNMYSLVIILIKKNCMYIHAETEK